MVGGGSAGCVVGRRMADARPRARVGLIEAGAGRDTFTTRIPGPSIRLIGDAKRAWVFASEPYLGLGGCATY